MHASGAPEAWGVHVVNPWREQLDRAKGRLYRFRWKGG